MYCSEFALVLCISNFKSSIPNILLLFTDVNTSQGIAFEAGGIFGDQWSPFYYHKFIVESAGERILKVDHYLSK